MLRLVSLEIYQLVVNVRVPDCAVEATGTEPKSLPDILKEEITLNLSLQSDLFNESGFDVYISPLSSETELTQHTRSDIDASPDVSLLIEDLTRKTRPASDIE